MERNLRNKYLIENCDFNRLKRNTSFFSLHARTIEKRTERAQTSTGKRNNLQSGNVIFTEGNVNYLQKLNVICLQNIDLVNSANRTEACVTSKLALTLQNVLTA